jgi:mono/diheme cytochrome c family protein
MANQTTRGTHAVLTTLLITIATWIPIPVRAEPAEPQNATPGTDIQIERGRYIVSIASCNECHTEGYMASGGRVPESEWLTGSSIGYQGAWGTSYASNLRLRLASMTESNWLILARTARLPPMPWNALQKMNDADLVAVYHFIRSLGPKGERSLRSARPGVTVNTPTVVYPAQDPAKQ